jgi:YD repeat-containing protein
MSNPLVAAPQDTTRGFSGIPIAEDAVSCYEGLSSGNWVEGGLGAVATAADIADTVANPFGALFAAGAGWLMEHFQPLREALDWLAGKPEVITSYGQTWDNVAKELGKIKTDHANLVSTDVASWQGAAADAYRGTTAQVSDALASASSVAGGLSTATTIMGALVSAVRTTVRDLIARLVGNAVQWLLEEAFTLGLATPVVVGQITAAVSNAMAKVTKLISKVTTTIRKVTPLLEKLKSLFAKIAEKLKALRRSGEPHTGAPRDMPHSPAKADTPTNPGHTVEDPRTASQSADRPFCKDDPIDVVTGEVVLSQTDVELPGLLPLVFVRHHQSAYRAGALFGPSWASTLDQRIDVGPQHVWLSTADGRRLRYPKPAGAQEVLPDFGPRMPLRRTPDGYTVSHPQLGLTYEFVTVGADWEARSTLPLGAVRRRGGGEITIEHDLDGLPTRVRHSGGYDIVVDTAGGRVTALRLESPEQPGGITLMRYTYESGQLSEVTNSSGAALRFTYEDDRLTSWTDRNGVWYRYLYDSTGRATSTVGSGGALNGSFDYQDRKTIHTDTLGHTTTYEMNELGQVVRETDALGAVTTREWDSHDRLVAVTNPLGHTSRYSHDDAGNVTAVTRPDGTTVTVTYTEHSLPAVTTDPAGGRWLREFDAEGNLRIETDPAGASTQFDYDNGHIRAITDPLGNTTRFETNAAGLITRITDPLGATTARATRSSTSIRWATPGAWSSPTSTCPPPASPPTVPARPTPTTPSSGSSKSPARTDCAGVTTTTRSATSSGRPTSTAGSSPTPMTPRAGSPPAPTVSARRSASPAMCTAASSPNTPPPGPPTTTATPAAGWCARPARTSRCSSNATAGAASSRKPSTGGRSGPASTPRAAGSPGGPPVSRPLGTMTPRATRWPCTRPAGR